MHESSTRACCSDPVNDSRSWRVHALFDYQACSIFSKHCNFSGGSRNSPCRVSITVPRKVKIGEGPSCLSATNGILPDDNKHQ